MFETLFTRPGIVGRYRAAPLLDERLGYLEHCALVGAPRQTLRAIAAHLVILVCLLDLHEGERVSRCGPRGGRRGGGRRGRGGRGNAGPDGEGRDPGRPRPGAAEARAQRVALRRGARQGELGAGEHGRSCDRGWERANMKEERVNDNFADDADRAPELRTTGRDGLRLGLDGGSGARGAAGRFGKGLRIPAPGRVRSGSWPRESRQKASREPRSRVLTRRNGTQLDERRRLRPPIGPERPENGGLRPGRPSALSPAARGATGREHEMRPHPVLRGSSAFPNGDGSGGFQSRSPSFLPAWLPEVPPEPPPPWLASRSRFSGDRP